MFFLTQEKSQVSVRPIRVGPHWIHPDFFCFHLNFGCVAPTASRKPKSRFQNFSLEAEGSCSERSIHVLFFLQFYCSTTTSRNRVCQRQTRQSEFSVQSNLKIIRLREKQVLLLFGGPPMCSHPIQLVSVFLFSLLSRHLILLQISFRNVHL